MRKIIVMLVAVIFLAVSCSTREGQIYRIDVEKAVSSSPKKLSLNEIADVVSIVELNSPDSAIFSSVSYENMSGDTLFLYLDGSIYAVSSENGSVLGRTGRAGRGPGEYIMPTSLAEDRGTGRMYVGDGASKRILEYDKNGNFLSKKDLENVYSVYILPDAVVII